MTDFDEIPGKISKDVKTPRLPDVDNFILKIQNREFDLRKCATFRVFTEHGSLSYEPLNKVFKYVLEGILYGFDLESDHKTFRKYTKKAVKKEILHSQVFESIASNENAWIKKSPEILKKAELTRKAIITTFGHINVIEFSFSELFFIYHCILGYTPKDSEYKNAASTTGVKLRSFMKPDEHKAAVKIKLFPYAGDVEIRQPDDLTSFDPLKFIRTNPTFTEKIPDIIPKNYIPPKKRK